MLALSTLNFCILPPSLVSAGICLSTINDLLARELGVYPLGGAKSVMHAYLQTYHELGGQIEFNKKVRRILVDENRVEGIETTSGDIIESKLVVGTTGIKETVSRLLPKNAVENRYVDSLKSIKPLPPPFTVILGLG